MSSKQKIVVISEDLVEPWDEGIKKFTYSLAQALKKTSDVLLVNVDRSSAGGEEAVRVPGTRSFSSRALRGAIREHESEIILYVPSPSNTTWSYVRSAMLRRAAPGAFVGMVALIPRSHSRRLRPVLKRLAPHMTWVPSYKTLLHLSRFSIPGDVLPVGVDPDVYQPAGEAQKMALRERHGIKSDAFVLLHVGHISPKRNLDALLALREIPDAEVVLIGSTSTPEDEGLRGRLDAGGVRVIREFVPVEEYYRLADCYVFPVWDDEGSVEMPLSVVEALASGIPVVSTPFGGLLDFFEAGPDFVYWHSEDDLVRAVSDLRSNGRPEVRSMAEFSWEHIAGRILDKVEQVKSS